MTLNKHEVTQKIQHHVRITNRMQCNLTLSSVKNSVRFMGFNWDHILRSTLSIAYFQRGKNVWYVFREWLVLLPLLQKKKTLTAAFLFYLEGKMDRLGKQWKNGACQAKLLYMLQWRCPAQNNTVKTQKKCALSLLVKV